LAYQGADPGISFTRVCGESPKHTQSSGVWTKIVTYLADTGISMDSRR
jgi:hypothetical protein